MKTIVSALLACMLAGSAWADRPASSPLAENPQSTLNLATHYLDSVLLNVLASLELIASTPEARSGDWNGIKPYLKRLETALPGAYYFVLPNGNYYSVARDYTNLNLSDRAYFKSLFAGNEVKGLPLYSRSTGRKSVLMAAPILVGNKVTGALGASIYLDELNGNLNRALALPQTYTWYVLNAEGNTILDRDSDFIFMNALTQGGSSLRAAVAKALKSEGGAMRYELEGIRRAYYQKLPDFDWWMFLAKIEGAQPHNPPQLKFSLKRFVPDLQRGLTRIDASLANLIEKSGIDVGDEREVRNLLDALLDENPHVVEAAFVDSKGFLRQIEPRDYRNFENTDINSQVHVSVMLKNPKPILSGGFTAVEGFLAVVISRPLHDRMQQLAGSINLVIRPDLLVDSLLRKTTIPADYELWIMQPDGLIIYDQDKAEIGRMLFGDPLYAGAESLLRLGERIASEQSGEGRYVFLAPGLKEKVIKDAVWQTVKLHNREWRVVFAYRPYERKN